MKQIFIALAVLLSLAAFGLFAASRLFPSRKTPAPIPFKSLEQTVSELGYEILYREIGDDFGRTVFYGGRGLYDGMGRGIREVSDISKADYITGAVSKEGLLPIEGTEDYLVTLVDPKTGDPLVRGMTLSGREVDGSGLSKITVEDLTRPASTALSFLVFVNELQREDLQWIIQPGDAIAIEVAAMPEEEAFTESIFPDIIDNLIIRRFGGGEQVGKELVTKPQD